MSNAPVRLVSQTSRHVLWSTNRPQQTVPPPQTHAGLVSGSQSFGNNRMADHHDDAERPGSSPSPPDEPHQRQIVDFDPDDNDWEDDDAQLDGLGTTTHRSRNRAVPVIPVRKHRRVRGANTRATAETRSKKADKRQSLAADLAAWEVEREERAQELSDKHSMKLKEVRRRMLSASAFKPKRKVSVYNAKIGRIMATENEGRELGEQLLMKDVKCMPYPSMLDGFTAEEEAEMVAELEEKRKTKFRGTRANNLAAGADAKRTVERMMVEITGLAERAGMIRFAMFTRGHIHDRTIPVTIQSWGALEFFREILKKDPADVAALFELWAVSRERGDTGADTLLGMQQDCTKMITDGLRAVLAKTKVKMNFENYIKVLVEGKNVGLIGWPEGVDFKHMSLQSKIGPLRILRDALRCGTVRWKVLSAGEKKRLVDQFREMVKTGEVQEKAGKAKTARKGSSRAARSKKTAREESSDDEEDAPARTTSKAVPKVSSRLSRARPKKTAREEPSGNNDDDDDPPRADLPRSKGNAPCKPISEMTVEEKRARLVGLVEKVRKVSTRERASGKTSKRARDEGGASGVDRPRKKVRCKENEREGEDGEERGRGKGSKRQRGAGKDDDEEEMRKKKKKRTGDNAQRAPAAKTTVDDTQSAPTNTKPRPKPRMKPCPGASTTTATNGASTSGATATSSNGATTSTPATSPNSAAAATNRATSTGSASATPSNEAPATSSSGEPASSTGGANATPSNEALATSSNPAAATTNSATSTSSAGATSSNEAPATSSQPARRNVVKGKAGGPPGLRV
ncbi:hypothetical protein DFH09DRAFT_1323900 [Mycena vulgaris]|nr:hypothetical protein DFH09DRAFT_1323900 [Mycena vulgaris]